jgi:hypothetical protein
MPLFPWYVEVPHDAPLGQGDIIDECPVVVFREIPAIGDAADGARLREALARSGD